MKIRKNLISVLLCAVLLFSQFTFCFASTASAAEQTWAGAWSTAPVKLGYYVGNNILTDFLAGVSVRTVLKTTLGGEKVRLRFSNRYGSSALKIAAVRIARTGKMSKTEIINGTSLPVTFNGAASVSIPAGKTIYSDAIDMHTEAFEMLSVSAYYESFTYMTTGGLINALSYVDPGNRIDEKTFTANAPLTLTSGSITYNTTPFLCGLDVFGEGNSCVALFGDSTLANDAPLYLAEKLYMSGEKTTGVLQEAIIGNHLLHDLTGVTRISNLYGESGLTRFKEDVLDQSGIKAVYVKIGLNDVLHPLTKSMGSAIPHPGTEDIIDGYRKLINMANKADIKIYFFSRQAWKGYQRNFYGSGGADDLIWTQSADDMMAVLNNWLKFSSSANGYINVDALRDPKDKTRTYAPYTTDGVHLTALGAQVLTDLIPSGSVSSNDLISIRDYYANGGTDMIRYTPEDQYTKIVPTTKPPANVSVQGPPNATGGAVLPTRATVPHTTSISITSPGGAPVTEIFLVEMPNNVLTTQVPAATVPTAQTMAYQVQPEKPATLSSTASAGIILFVLLTVALVAVGVIYGANKKMSED